jgi:hypothetical protein
VAKARSRSVVNSEYAMYMRDAKQVTVEVERTAGPCAVTYFCPPTGKRNQLAELPNSPATFDIHCADDHLFILRAPQSR